MKRSALPSIAALGAALALTACATPTAPESANLATQVDRHKIMVTQAAHSLDVPVAVGDDDLSAPTLRRVETFARAYIGSGHGSLVMSVPSGGENADDASRIAHRVRVHLASIGVPFAAIAGSTYDAEGRSDAPVVLSFTRFDATAPECKPIWQQDLSANADNTPWHSFGCSMQANLAAMIADPADLIQPREETPRDAARRANVLDAYRRGQQSHSQRSNDERVSVSNAVQ